MPFNPKGNSSTAATIKPIFTSFSQPPSIEKKEKKKQERKKINRKTTTKKRKQEKKELPFSKEEVAAAERVIKQWIKIRENRVKKRKNSAEGLMSELAQSFLDKLLEIYKNE